MQNRNKDFDKLNINLGSVPDPKIEIKEQDQVGIQEISNPSINQIMEELKKSVCTLFFYKNTNGAFRRMVCTFNGHEPVPSKFNKSNVIVVWDLEHNNWRSFYPNRVFKLVRNEKTTVQ